MYNTGNSPVMISFPGLKTGRDGFIDEARDSAKNAEVIYKIPPPVWMILLLVIGYLGIRKVMED